LYYMEVGLLIKGFSRGRFPVKYCIYCLYILYTNVLIKIVFNSHYQILIYIFITNFLT